MTTFKDMVDETLLHLAGYGMRNDAVTYITSAITSSATSLTVADTESLGKGMLEIGDELIYVSSFDRSTGVVGVPPFGRGFSGTTAVSHASGSMATLNPVFTRQAVKKALNDTITAVFPGLFGVSSYTFTYSPAQLTYSLPSAAQTVLSVSYETIGASKEWKPVRAWRLDAMADPSTFSSSNSITLLSGIDPGRSVRVFYTTEPDILESDIDDFSAITGFPESSKDVIIYGAAYRLLSFIPAGRLNFATADAEMMSSRIDIGSGTNIAKYVYALYQQRLAEESKKLVDKYPIRPHFTN